MQQLALTLLISRDFDSDQTLKGKKLTRAVAAQVPHSDDRFGPALMVDD